MGRSRARGSPSKVDVAGGQGGDRGQEPHDRAGEAAVDAGRTAQRAGSDHPVGTLVVDTGAQAAQRRSHELGVARAQCRAQPGRALGERRQDQVAVGQRLGTGQPDDGVHRVGGGRCGPQRQAHGQRA